MRRWTKSTALLLALIPGSAYADVWIGAASYPDIASAMLVAGAGDTLTLDPGVYNEAVVVTIDLTIDGGGQATIDWSGAGNAVVDIEALRTVTLRGLTLSSTNRRGIDLQGGNTVVVQDVTVTGTHTTTNGGGLRALSVDSLTLTNVTFDGTTADLEGGALYVDAASLVPVTLTDVTFTNTVALGDGGAIRVRSVDLDCTRCAFVGTSGQDGGALYDAGTSVLRFVDSRFDATVASGFGGAVRAASDLTVDRSTFCRPSAGAGGAIYSTAAGGAITNSSFNEASAPFSAAVFGVGAWTLTNDTLVATDGDGVAVQGVTGVLTLRNTAITQSSAHGVVLSGGATGSLDYNLYNSNGSGNVSGVSTGANDLTSVPQYAAFTNDGDCANDQLWPAPTSPLLDAGDPAVLDPDGSRSDIGAYGGPGADPAVHDDADNDGSGFLRDCDEGDPTTFPGAAEVCDSVDNDCDGAVDDSPVDLDSWYPDCDGDGQGALNGGVVECFEPAFAGCAWVSLAALGDDAWADCDDGDPTVFYGADELCAAGDQDCDGDDDLGAVDANSYYPDGDADGYGGLAEPFCAFSPPVGYAAEGGDCDDGDDTIHPDAVDPCDATLVDEDCNGGDGEPGDQVEWYADADDDGYGDDPSVTGGLPTLDCHDLSGSGYTDLSLALDCDDGDADVNPGEAEVCNTVDDDCNGSIDDVGAPITWFEDVDLDGFGDQRFPVTAACAPEGDWLDVGGDCDDGDDRIHPTAAETCNAVDDDCDALVDAADPDATGTFDAYVDADGDTYGSCHPDPAGCDPTPVCAADLGDGWSDLDTDCDDGSAEIHPGADEVTGNSVDEDCDGVAVGSDPVPTDDEDAGCNCAHGPGPSGAWLLLGLGALAARRRRG